MDNDDLNKGLEDTLPNQTNTDDTGDSIQGTSAADIMNMSSEDYAKLRDGQDETPFVVADDNGEAQPNPDAQPQTKPEEKPEEKPEDKPAETKPEEQPEAKPEDKPEEKPAETKPEDKPAETKPETKPEDKPAETKTTSTGTDTGKSETKPEDKPAADAGSTDSAEDKPAETKEPEGGYKKAFETLTGTFKADGVDMQVNSVEEAIQLMQKGVAFHNKQEKLAPYMPLLKTLEKAKLLDRDTINEFVEIKVNKNPKAVAKLLKSIGLDPVTDIEMEGAEKHQNPNYVAPQDIVGMEEAIDRTATTEHGRKLIISIDKNWDEASKDMLAKQPGVVLGVLTKHQDAGLYDKINSRILQQKVLGNLDGVPYLKAYYDFAEEELKANPIADNPSKPGGANPSTQSEVKPDSAKPKGDESNFKNDDKVNTNSTVAKTGGATTEPPVNYATMSSEEFEKHRKTELATHG